MTYLKEIKILFFISWFSLISFTGQADIKPYTATYDVYAKGFHVGNATQTLHRIEDKWLIKLHTEPKGFARFIQSNPATQEQLFTLQPQLLLISAKSDSGKSNPDAKNTAYYDKNSKQLYIIKGNTQQNIRFNFNLSSYLLLPISASALQNNQPINVTVYDKGKIKNKIMTLKSSTESLKIIDVTSQNSNKTLRYIFKTNNLHVPFRIEKFKKGELKAYLQLKTFEQNIL